MTHIHARKGIALMANTTANAAAYVGRFRAPFPTSAPKSAQSFHPRTIRSTGFHRIAALKNEAHSAQSQNTGNLRSYTFSDSPQTLRIDCSPCDQQLRWSSSWLMWSVPSYRPRTTHPNHSHRTAPQSNTSSNAQNQSTENRRSYIPEDSPGSHRSAHSPCEHSSTP